MTSKIAPRSTPNRHNLRRVEARWGVLMALPAILGFVLWHSGPMLASLVISFTNWPVVSAPKWTGIENYVTLLRKDPLFWKSLYVTGYYTFLSVPLVIVTALLVAQLLNQKVRGLAIFRTIFYLPTVVPAVASSILWLWLFNPDFGLFTSFLDLFGHPGFLWIYDERQVIPSLALMSVWGMGNTMVIFLAGLQGVPTQYYEAAEIDGATAFRKWLHITVPMMSPIIFFNLVMGIIGTFQVFSQAYVMTEGGPNNASLFMVYYLFLQAFDYGRMGYASAIAWILFMIVIVFTIIVFRTSPYWVYYETAGRR